MRPAEGRTPDGASSLWSFVAAELARRHALADELYALVKAQQAAVQSMRLYLVRAHEELHFAEPLVQRLAR